MKKHLFILILCLSSILATAAERPRWMDEEGIVMAGNWEEPAFRARRVGYTDFKMPPEWIPGYEREHSQEMIDSLKSIGVNFVMTHGYKGYGFEIERQGMQDAVRFAHLAHASGLRVGAYIGSTLGWETLFQEIPAAKDWLWLDPNGEPGFYNKKQTHRYLAMKNHPGYKNYIKKAIRFAIEEMNSEIPLDVAEAMAFNRNCLGCITWFEGGELLSGHVGLLGKFPRNILPFVRFFHQHHNFYCDAYPMPDVALLFDFETLAFSAENERNALLQVEELLQRIRIPYAILFNQHESEFNNYPAIIAAPSYEFQNYNRSI